MTDHIQNWSSQEVLEISTCNFQDLLLLTIGYALWKRRRVCLKLREQKLRKLARNVNFSKFWPSMSLNLPVQFSKLYFQIASPWSGLPACQIWTVRVWGEKFYGRGILKVGHTFHNYSKCAKFSDTMGLWVVSRHVKCELILFECSWVSSMHPTNLWPL